MSGLLAIVGAVVCGSAALALGVALWAQGMFLLFYAQMERVSGGLLGLVLGLLGYGDVLPSFGGFVLTAIAFGVAVAGAVVCVMHLLDGGSGGRASRRAAPRGRRVRGRGRIIKS